MRIMEYVDGCVTCLAPVNNVYKFSGRDWQAHLLPYAKDFLDLFSFSFWPARHSNDISILYVLQFLLSQQTSHTKYFIITHIGSC